MFLSQSAADLSCRQSFCSDLANYTVSLSKILGESLASGKLVSGVIGKSRYLHDTMGVGMIVDGAASARSPYQDQLHEGLVAYP